MKMPAIYDAIGISRVIHVGEVPTEDPISKSSQYYKLTTFGDDNGCPLFDDALQTIKDLGIPYSLGKRAFESDSERIGTVYYLWFEYASEEEYLAFKSNPYVRQRLLKKNNQDLLCLLTKDYISMEEETLSKNEEELQWEDVQWEDVPW